MLDEVLGELKQEIDRSTLQCIVVEDSSKRYMLPPELVDEVLKHLLGEFLIGLLGLELLHGLGQRLHMAGTYLRSWVSVGTKPTPADQTDLDAALEEALKAARAHARTEAQMLAASERVEALMRKGGASYAETRDVVDTVQGILGKCWTK